MALVGFRMQGAVMKHDFDLRFRLEGSALGGDDIAGRLAAAGCEDCLVGIGVPGRLGLHFTREADSMEAAVESALADVRRALPGAVLDEALSFEDPSVTAALELIRRVFGLSDGELAEVCGGADCDAAARWLEGGTPDRAMRARVFDLRRAALGWAASGFAPPGAELAVPIVHERTLFDLLRAEPLDFDAIDFAGERIALKRELSARRRLVDPFRWGTKGMSRRG